jgi:hypothetical protein
MLSTFDWIRRCRRGDEILATLEYADVDPELFAVPDQLGPPISLFERPCGRCWIYPCLESAKEPLCRTCLAIDARARNLRIQAGRCVIAWGYVNRLPAGLVEREGYYADHLGGAYIHDDRHFLVMLNRQRIKAWLQEILIYHGDGIKGLIQIMPTTPGGPKWGMGDALCRAVHLDARFPLDCLRVRFYSSPYQLFSPRIRDEKGMLTFEVAAFVRLLEMATVFRTLLRPREQMMLHELVHLKDKKEEQFYWGRFMGYLTPEARDMLTAWKIRSWPPAQVKLLYELLDYVEYSY